MPADADPTPLREAARRYFEDAQPAHDWHHVGRVEALAWTLADRHPDPVDREVLALAVWFHDVGRSREDSGEIDDHAAWGAAEARVVLNEHGVEPDTIERVAHCIRAHRYSTGPEPESVEAAILSDADNLDALGAVGIARVFAHGGALGISMHDPELSPASDDPSAGETGRGHFETKILGLPDRMYTDPGRDVAAERAAFVRQFLDRFDREVDGNA